MSLRQLTMNIPRSLASHIFIEDQEGTETEYLVQCFYHNDGEKRVLFSIDIYSKEFIADDLPFPSF